MNTSASTQTLNGAGVRTAGRDALTGAQLLLLAKAAQRALLDNGTQISSAKVNKLVRKVTDAHRRSRLGWCEFMQKIREGRIPIDPIARRVIAYADPTGEKAARNVDRQRGWH